MTEQQNLSLKSYAKHGLDERTQNENSWLIYLSQDLGNAFRWGKNEIDLVVDSINSAFSTTKNITNMFAMRLKQGQSLSSGEEALLQELGLVVPELPDGDYLPLQQDDGEFQQLATQLQPHSKEVGGKAAVMWEPCREITPEGPHEVPAEISQEVIEEMPEKEDAPESASAEKYRETRGARSSKKTVTDWKETKKDTSRPSPGERPAAVDSTAKAATAKKEPLARAQPPDELSTAESRKTKQSLTGMKRYSPLALAGLANDGFLSIARAAGKAVSFVQSGTMGGLSKIGHVLSRGKKEKKSRAGGSKRLTEPVKEEFLPQEASAGQALVSRPSPANGEATQPPESRSDPVTEEEPPRDEEMEQEGLQYPPLDLEAFLKQHSPRDKVEAIRLRKTLDDLLLGSEAARHSALKSLVGLHQVAKPFMVASLQTASPQVAEIALAGLSQTGSQRLIGCICDVHASSDPELRIVALRAAQRLTDDEARPFLERGLRDPNAKVKRRALSYLSWHDSPWALAEIRRLCNDPEPKVKWTALETLLTVRPSEAYDNLELMMPSLDPAYRRRAITLLEQRKHLTNKNSTDQTPSAPVQVSSTLDVGEKAKETGSGQKDIQKSVDAHSSQGALSKKTEEKKSKQPGRTREIKERASTNEKPEESGRSTPEVTAKSDV